jgi:peroxiredoxin family protein
MLAIDNDTGNPAMDDVDSIGRSLDEQRAALEELGRRVDRLAQNAPEDRLSLVVFSGDLDRQLAAFVMATGAAASGMHVSMFFTFWGIGALRRPARVKKDFWGRVFGLLLPAGASRLPLSQMNLGGVGPVVMRHLMRKKGVCSLEELIATAAELDVNINVCTMSMELLGLERDEIVEYPQLGYCGAASFVDIAARSRTTLFL